MFLNWPQEASLVWTQLVPFQPKSELTRDVIVAILRLSFYHFHALGKDNRIYSQDQIGKIIGESRILTCHVMLTAATLLVAKYWKYNRLDSKGKKYMCLMNKLTAINKFSLGNVNTLKAFEIEWTCCIKSKYNDIPERFREQVSSILK